MDLAFLVHFVEQDTAGVPAVDHDRDIGFNSLRSFLQQPLLKTRVGRLQVGDDLAHIGPFDPDDLLAAGQITHEGRDVDGCHGRNTQFHSKQMIFLIKHVLLSYTKGTVILASHFSWDFTREQMYFLH